MGKKWVWVVLAVGLSGTAAASETAYPAAPDTVYELDEMVVVGTRVVDARRDLPVSVSVISGEAVRASATVRAGLTLTMDRTPR